MPSLRICLYLTFILTAYVSSALLVSLPPPRSAWTPLCNGRNLDGWTVKIHHHAVGENFGKLQPGAPGYTLRNSGVMFHAQDPGTMPPERTDEHCINSTSATYIEP